MKKLLVLIAVACTQTVQGFTYNLYNQTRSKISVKLNIAAAPDRDIEMAPESYHQEVLEGLQTVAYVRALEVMGIDEPVASLGRTVHDIQGNPLSPTKTFYIGHKNPEYAAGTVMVAGSSRLAIRPGSGSIVVEER